MYIRQALGNEQYVLHIPDTSGIDPLPKSLRCIWLRLSPHQASANTECCLQRLIALHTVHCHDRRHFFCCVFTVAMLSFTWHPQVPKAFIYIQSFHTHTLPLCSIGAFCLMFPTQTEINILFHLISMLSKRDLIFSRALLCCIVAGWGQGICCFFSAMKVMKLISRGTVLYNSSRNVVLYRFTHLLLICAHCLL